MATSILLKFLTLKWNISITIGRIEVGDGSFFFCIFHALSFELNFFFDRRFPLRGCSFECSDGSAPDIRDTTSDQLFDDVTKLENSRLKERAFSEIR